MTGFLVDVRLDFCGFFIRRELVLLLDKGAFRAVLAPERVRAALAGREMILCSDDVLELVDRALLELFELLELFTLRELLCDDRDAIELKDIFCFVFLSFFIWVQFVFWEKTAKIKSKILPFPSKLKTQCCKKICSFLEEGFLRSILSPKGPVPMSPTLLGSLWGLGWTSSRHPPSLGETARLAVVEALFNNQTPTCSVASLW